MIFGCDMQSGNKLDLNMAYHMVPTMVHPYTALPYHSGYLSDQQQFHGGYGGPHIAPYYQPSSPQHVMMPNLMYSPQSPVYPTFVYPDLPQPLSHGYDPRGQIYGYQGDQLFVYSNGQQNGTFGAYYDNCSVSSSQFASDIEPQSCSPSSAGQRDGDGDHGRRASDSSEELRVGEKKHPEGTPAGGRNDEDLSIKLQKLLKVQSEDKSKTAARSTSGPDSADQAKTPDEEPDNHRKTPPEKKEEAVVPKRFCCKFCKSNGETYQIFGTHDLKNEAGQVTCPILMKFVCPICKKTGAEAHTEKYCAARGGSGTATSHKYRKVRNSVGRLCVLKY